MNDLEKLKTLLTEFGIGFNERKDKEMGCVFITCIANTHKEVYGDHDDLAVRFEFDLFNGQSGGMEIWSN